MDKSTKNREARARRMAYRKGYILHKSKARNPENPTFGGYQLADFNNHAVLGTHYSGFEESLEGIEEFLK